jgi:cytochrome oxidase Cu insertion factor (SCO1/SenC/PrrC family)
MSPRTKLALLLTVFVLPTLASFAAFYWFPPTKTGNYGELVVPVVNLPLLPLAIVDGTDAAAGAGEQALRGKWLIVTRDSGACDALCEQKLFAMRQTRLIVGREMDRIVRVVLIDDDALPSGELVKRYQGTAWIPAKSLSWLPKFPSTSPDVSGGRAFFYAVDPMGNIFMRYGADADVKLIAKDLQRVLKASQIG